LDLDRILVEVYPTPPAYKGSQEFVCDLFVKVNKAKLVKWVNMPSVMMKADCNMINQAATLLHAQFHPMFKASQNCCIPHVHLDTLCNAVFAADVLSWHQLTSAKALYVWLLEQNECMQIMYCVPAAVTTKMATSEDAGKTATKANNTTPMTVSPKALNKAQKHNFYLSLDASWYYN